MSKKTALVTGGSRGIGLGIVRSLLSDGYQVAINGIRDEEDIKSVLNELKADSQIIYCQGDISIPEDRTQIIEKAIQKFGTINLLINNAGVAPKERADVLEVKEEDYDFVIGINLKGTFFLTQSIAKMMIAEHQKNSVFDGCIINISSVSAELVSINRAAYCMSKAGMSMMTKLMAVRMSEINVPVYEIRPGIIETDMTAGVREKYEQMIDQGLTLEKRLGTPEDVGRIVTALANGSIPYSTGQVIDADGGLRIQRL